MTLLALLAQSDPSPVDPFPPGPIGDPEGDYPLLTVSAGQNMSSATPTGSAGIVADRALNWFFEGEPVSFAWTDGADLVAWRVRDYEGNVVASGVDPTSPLDLGAVPVGWYKLYLERGTPAPLPYDTSGGEVTFVVSRTGMGLQDVPLLPSEVARDNHSVGTVPGTRAYLGHGAMRVDARLHPDDAAAWRTALDRAIDKVAECMAYRPDEPGAPERLIFAHITDGTGGADPSPQAVAQLTATVQELVAAGVTWFEGQNEPMSYSGAQVAAHYEAFAAIAHAAHPDARVMGPCPVSITSPPERDQLAWLEDFLSAGGGSYIDGLSFHPYNAVEGDAHQGRQQYEAFLGLLVDYGVDHLPRFMTEYGTFASVYGSYEPRWQAQVTMLDWHLMWQVLGVHRNNTYYFYDINHGYWNYPSGLFAAGAGRVNPHPAALMFRTWVEETWGMELVEKLDFGPVEDHHYVGSQFAHGDGRSTLTVQAAGRVGEVILTVTGASELEAVDHFGRVVTVPVTGGVASVPVGPEPVHVRVPSGASAAVAPVDYGVDVTPRSTMQVDALTYGSSPVVAADGDLGTFWEAMVGDAGPSWWRMRFATPLTFDTVEVVCPVPWQIRGSLIDFDLHALVDGQWVVLHTEDVPVVSEVWTSAGAAGGTFADSFWDRRRIFVAHLNSPVTAQALRIYARSFSFGGAATLDQARTLRVLDGAGMGTIMGQAGRRRMALQDVRVYRAST